VYPDYDIDAQYAAIAAGNVPDNPFVYISIGSLKDPTNQRIAPPGMSNLQLISLAPSTPQAWGVSGEQVRDGSYRRSENYREKKKQYARQLLRMAESVLPGLTQQIDFQEVATPLTHSRYTGSTAGTSYGIAATPAQYLFGRPSSRTDVGGLYLCGASCRMGHGIIGVMMSGLNAADQLVRGSLFLDVFRGR
jgi:all-trans-retinol 13,14-reductase